MPMPTAPPAAVASRDGTAKTFEIEGTAKDGPMCGSQGADQKGHGEPADDPRQTRLAKGVGRHTGRRDRDRGRRDADREIEPESGVEMRGRDLATLNDRLTKPAAEQDLEQRNTGKRQGQQSEVVRIEDACQDQERQHPDQRCPPALHRRPNNSLDGLTTHCHGMSSADSGDRRTASSHPRRRCRKRPTRACRYSS